MRANHPSSQPSRRTDGRAILHHYIRYVVQFSSTSISQSGFFQLAFSHITHKVVGTYIFPYTHTYSTGNLNDIHVRIAVVLFCLFTGKKNIVFDPSPCFTTWPANTFINSLKVFFLVLGNLNESVNGSRIGRLQQPAGIAFSSVGTIIGR